MILQLNPPIPVITPKGKALAHLVIDDGIEHDLKWVCFQDDSGECWTYSNPSIKAQKNITQNRKNISPPHDPDNVKLPKKDPNMALWSLGNKVVSLRQLIDSPDAICDEVLKELLELINQIRIITGNIQT